MPHNRTLWLGLGILAVVLCAIPVLVRSDVGVRYRFDRLIKASGGHWWQSNVIRTDSGERKAGAAANHPGGRPYMFIVENLDPSKDFRVEVRVPIIERDHPGMTVATFEWKDGRIGRPECLEKYDQPNMPWLSARAEEFGRALTAALQ
jgi:hypothetical protein